MHYIINPFLIYTIEVIGSLGFTLCLFAWIALLYSCYLLIRIPILQLEVNDRYYKEESQRKIDKAKEFNKIHSKKIIIGTIIFCLLQSFIPTKEVMYKMLVASMVTTENINSVKGEAKELVDYITDSVKEIIKETEK